MKILKLLANMGRSIVIANKFNDIIYSISTPEFIETKHNILILCYTYNMTPNFFPFQDKFSTVIRIKLYKNHRILSILFFLFEIIKKQRHFKMIKYLFLSNPNMLNSHIVYKLTNPLKIILIEDGLMNYSPYSPDKSIVKNLAFKLLHINEYELFKNIKFSYLLMPEQSVFAFGEKQQILINPALKDSLNINISALITQKKIFIGQNLYPKMCSKEKYYSYVQTIINYFQIDIYIPHLFEEEPSLLENVMVVRSDTLSLTLECYAPFFTFAIYSFGSSLLYSLKAINSKIETYLIQVPFYSLPSAFIMNICNASIKYEDIQIQYKS
jgi:hypothetical protein